MASSIGDNTRLQVAAATATPAVVQPVVTTMPLSGAPTASIALDRLAISATAHKTAQVTAGLADVSREIGDVLLEARAVQTPLEQTASDKSVARTVIVPTTSPVTGSSTLTSASGALAEVLKAQTRAFEDFNALQRAMLNPQETTATRIALAAKAIQSASAFVGLQDDLVKSLSEADRVVLTQNSAYARLTEATRNSRVLQTLTRLNNDLMTRLLPVVEVGGSVAGMTASVLTMPQVLQSLRSNSQKLVASVNDATATGDQRVNAATDLSRSSIATIHGFESIRVSGGALVNAAAHSELLGSAATALTGNGVMRFGSATFGHVMGALMPVADVALLGVDGVNLYKVWQDPAATASSKGRAILAVGLDGLKLATYMLAMTSPLRMLYIGVTLAQVGLATWDLTRAKTTAPVATSTAVASPTAIVPANPPITATTHPWVQAAVAGAQEVVKTMGDAASFVQARLAQVVTPDAAGTAIAG